MTGGERGIWGQVGHRRASETSPAGPAGMETPAEAWEATYHDPSWCLTLSPTSLQSRRHLTSGQLAAWLLSGHGPLPHPHL